MKRFLRLIGILMMGITAAVTLLGGVGTTCVALNPTNYESMKAIASLQWLYILYVVIGVALGVLGIQATVHLAQGKVRGERSALLILIGGVIIGGIHMATSRALRGSSMPVDGVVYITALTLVIFLLFQLPKVKEMAVFQKDRPDTGDKVGGITAIVIGLLVLGVQYWAGPTHLMEGINYADAFHQALAAVGSASILLGSWLTFRSYLPENSAFSFRLQR